VALTTAATITTIAATITATNRAKFQNSRGTREQPKHDHKVYGSSSGEDEEGEHADPANQQRNPIVSLQTIWNIDEAVRIALKSEQIIKKHGIGRSMYKTKTDINQSSSSQSGGDAQVDHSKSTHEFDGGKKKKTTTTTSTHAVKSSINPYARLRVNLAEGDKAHSESEDKGLIISPDVVFEDDDDHSEALLDVFNVIVDGGSSENIISRDIVTHLKLTPKKHPKPYKIGWINAVREVSVTEQCEVLFAMGKYKDTILFDIVDMDCHVLLGRPWKYDLNVVHKRKENTYTFSKGGRKFTLCPYSDEVQATITKVKTNYIMLCSTKNKEKNICATTIPPDQVLYHINS
ncbi:putative receptor protein kinase ZmPK1, partial [Tanacetum coccineum]